MKNMIKDGKLWTVPKTFFMAEVSGTTRKREAEIYFLKNKKNIKGYLKAHPLHLYRLFHCNLNACQKIFDFFFYKCIKISWCSTFRNIYLMTILFSSQFYCKITSKSKVFKLIDKSRNLQIQCNDLWINLNG